MKPQTNETTAPGTVDQDFLGEASHCSMFSISAAVTMSRKILAKTGKVAKGERTNFNAQYKQYEIT